MSHFRRIALVLLAVAGLPSTASAQMAPPLTPPLTPPCLTCTTLPDPKTPKVQKPVTAVPARPSAPAQAVAERRWSGGQSSVTRPDTMVVQSRQDWARLAALTGDRALAGFAFDPAHHAAVGVFLGRRNTGGYGVRVLSNGPRQGRYVVEVDEIRPAPGAFVTQALTAPWLVLVFPRPGLPIVVEPRFRTRN